MFQPRSHCPKSTVRSLVSAHQWVAMIPSLCFLPPVSSHTYVFTPCRLQTLRAGAAHHLILLWCTLRRSSSSINWMNEWANYWDPGSPPNKSIGFQTRWNVSSNTIPVCSMLLMIWMHWPSLSVIRPAVVADSSHYCWQWPTPSRCAVPISTFVTRGSVENLSSNHLI